MKQFRALARSVAFRRSGAVMIIAIIALVLCSAVSVSMFRTTTLRQKRFEMRHNQLQAQLLADSAIDRAARQLGDDLSFREEKWEVTIGEEQGLVQITLDETSSGEFAMEIMATYPVEATRRVQVSTDTILAIPTQALTEPADGKAENP